MATVRRVRRIVRKIDPWTVLKVSALVWAVIVLAVVLGIVIFWSVFERAGIPDRFTEFLVEITLITEGTDPFANTEQFFRVLVFSSIVGWVAATGMSVLSAVIYNLVSDVVGGIEVVVLEETLNPVPSAPAVIHPPVEFSTPTTPPEAHADIPTEEHPQVVESTR